MYKVLLVDDEAWILAGLQAMIDWNGEGFDICATASSGAEMEDKVRRYKPDLILADIRMPGCDGLTALKKLRQAGCAALYAIISGYAEFSYAQEGIRLGACGYLLKPIEEEELLALLRTARTALRERYEKLLMDELERDTGLVASLFNDVCWITVAYGGAGALERAPALCCRLSRGSRMYLSGEPLFSQESEIPADVYIGTCCYRPGRDGDFALAVAACREASWQGFIWPDRRLFAPKDLPQNASVITITATPQQLIQQYRESLGDVTLRQLYALYLTVQGYTGGIQPDTPEWLLEHYQNAKQLLERLEAELWPREEHIDDSVSVTAYLKEHFQEDLSLDSVSQALSMSGSSVRRVLLRESGDTYQHYLVKLRLEHACLLLRNGGQSINEVAYACGFHDALYFRRVFKKWFHVTPSNYRSGVKG